MTLLRGRHGHGGIYRKIVRAGYENSSDQSPWSRYTLSDHLSSAFHTEIANNGARHHIEDGFYLGYGVDSDVNGQPDPAAPGDDQDGHDDEDTFTMITKEMISGQGSSQRAHDYTYLGVFSLHPKMDGAGVCSI